MPFVSPDCDDYVGKTVICLPVYCHGWGRADLEETTDFEPIKNAGTFLIRIDGFFHYKERRIGIFGVIAEAEHLFSGLLFEATLMHKGEFNFTDRLCLRIDIDIGPKYPSKRGMVMTEGVPIYNGTVMIALDSDCLLGFRRKLGFCDE